MHYNTKEVLLLISYIKGILTQIDETSVIVETAGIGYQMQMSLSDRNRLPKEGSELKVYTYMNVKEDGISLFGFLSQEELNLFHKLITVTGVGPKGALAFFHQMQSQEIIMAILSEDVKTLCKAPGIGKKTAQRIILELKDKFNTEQVVEQWAFSSYSDSPYNPPASNSKSDAAAALEALGYSRNEVLTVLGKIDCEGLTTEEILKKALQKFI